MVTVSRLDKVDPAEIAKYYKRVDDKDVKPIAEKWVREVQVVDPSPQTVVNAARLYLAMKRLMADPDADGIAPDCGTLSHHHRFKCWKRESRIGLSE